MHRACTHPLLALPGGEEEACVHARSRLCTLEAAHRRWSDFLLCRRRRLDRPANEVLQPGAPGHATCCLNLHDTARRPSPPLRALRVLCAHACCRLLHAASRRPRVRAGLEITIPAADRRAGAPIAAHSGRTCRSQLPTGLVRQPRAAASLYSGQGGSGWGHRVGSQDTLPPTSLASLCDTGAPGP